MIFSHYLCVEGAVTGVLNSIDTERRLRDIHRAVHI